MPTQEERLSTLEQTVAALKRGIWDIDHNETILLGMAVKQDENIREIKSSLAALSGRFETFEQSVNGRFEALDGRFEAFEQSVNGRFGALDGRFEALEHSMNGRFGALDGRFEGQDKKFDQILLLLNTLVPKSE